MLLISRVDNLAVSLYNSLVMSGNLERLYIDESGTHDYHDFTQSKYQDPAKRFLALLGVAIERSCYQGVSDRLEQIKRQRLKQDPDNPIVFHRSDIVNKRKAFSVLRDPEIERAFNDDLIALFNELLCTLFLVVIDKKSLIEKHGLAAFHPYQFGLTAILERYCGYLNHWNDRGDVMAEGRQGKEDMNLKAAYSYVYQHGTYYRDGSFFQRALTSREIKIKPKTANIPGLQIADLLAHPCKQRLLAEKGFIDPPTGAFGQQIYRRIEHKFNMHTFNQRVDGYGKVFIG